MSTLTAPRAANKLIAAVHSKDRARLLANCETINLVCGERLSEPDKPINHVYFPLDGFISLVTSLDGHQPLEIGLVGNEGMLGATLKLGIKTAPLRAVVQGSGTALRMTGPDFLRLLGRAPAMLRVLDGYLYVMLAQLARSSACARFHDIEPRLARWLLMIHDRTHADHFHLTHELLAGMLGVRRSGVSIAAGALQLRKLIRYSRGEITILNRHRLEDASCECYDAMLDDYADVLGPR